MRKCGCVEGQYQCDVCRTKEHLKIWKNMSEKRKNYDRYVDPHGSRSLDELSDGGCSCHINPPCDYCVSLSDEEED